MESSLMPCCNLGAKVGGKARQSFFVLQTNMHKLLALFDRLIPMSFLYEDV